MQQQKKKKKHFAQGGSGYIRKCEDIKQYVITSHLQRQHARLENISLRPSKFCNALNPEDLGFETIVQSPEPADYNNLIMVKQWEFSYKTYYDQMQHQLVASSQAFVVVLRQCSPAVVNQLNP
jgi:hypothetical protein